ncbi:MAG: RsmE family RNA methyltransferase [Halanaerobiales bacterium]
MNRFFIKQKKIDEDIVKIDEPSDYKHIAYSLRLQPGDKVTICTGDGLDYLVELRKFYQDKNLVIGRIINKKKNINEPGVNITLAQAIPKKRNMELVAEKGTEIGFKKLIPVNTKRTVVKLNRNKKNKRISRWQRIVEAAAKQSQRGIIPEVEDLYEIKDIVNIIKDYDLVMVFYTEEISDDINDIFNKIKLDKNEIENILVMIGPEGGFTEEEVEFIREHDNAFSVTLGPRILRTETAGLVALTAILYEFGELGS